MLGMEYRCQRRCNVGEKSLALGIDIKMAAREHANANGAVGLIAPCLEMTQPMSPGRWLRSRKPAGFCGGGSKACSMAVIACTTAARSPSSSLPSNAATSSRDRLSSSAKAARPFAATA